MSRVMIFSAIPNEADQIKQKLLDSLEEVAVDVIVNESDVMKHLVLNSIGVIVLNYDSVTPQKIQFAKDLRTLGNNSAIVVLAPQLDGQTLKKMEKIYKSTVIQKPVRRNDLVGVIAKYLRDQMVSQRLHERYVTNAPSQIESFGGEPQKTPSRMLNVSRTGAYLECPINPRFSVGDLVRLDVELADLNKTRSVHAKVVWISHQANRVGNFGTGVRFIPEREVYKHMLNMV